MTERELSRAVHLKAELDALRRVAAEETSAEVLRAVDRQARYERTSPAKQLRRFLRGKI